eukprot:CAMPEP_0181317340 /NCGR_PEP_ID=MMETSP1101-20121128/16416_1 /TAXON_ID=46948 /ORGANISM="Rhodomonas abbreviata, Strain Caron Lab Isolate" /LENGTH=267 /DNA_ID=CAMNT_0023424727 /DNA_START=13 /DNA_END=816 /DNA_ORIENTATION=+
MAAAAAGLLKQLKEAALKKPSPDSGTALKVLGQLKVAMMSFSSLPGMTPAGEANKEELLITRETYELACLVMVAEKDIPGFERHMSLAKTCYTDYGGILPQSEYQYQMQGLNLLCLLAQSKIAEFHTELELIPVDLWENPCIKFPIKLEQYLMEGSYPKVLTSVEDVPAPSYHYFVSMLSGTVRDSIAESSEAAYDSLPLEEALKMLKMSSVSELEDYATMRERGWDVDQSAKVVRFREEHKVDLEVPSQRLIIETLSYAKELERIV